MATISVNGKDIAAPEGSNLLEVLKKNNVRVPALCHMPDLFPSGACRMCVVEIDGQRGLTPSCSAVVSEGMVVNTHTQRVVKARKTIVELLLANHPDECLYCDRNRSCELQDLAAEYDVRERRFSGDRNRNNLDVSSASLIRDPDKCILCGRCVRVCEEVQTVSAIDFINRGCETKIGTAYDEGLNVSSCINCGQCIRVCPTGALADQTDIARVEAAIADPDTIVVAQHAPSISITIGEAFGCPTGTDVCGALTAGLRQLGFDKVFDTSFSADLTIMEEASELIDRITTGKPLPMMTSCSPGWIKFVEHFYPDMLPNLSTCKSPQQMMGAIIKSYFAKKAGIDPKKIFSVSVMPCTAKKFEADRSEMQSDGLADVNAVLTTRELVRMFRKAGINLSGMDPEEGDNPLAERSTAGKIFGSSGGVMEAAVRTAYSMVTGREMDNLDLQAVRDFQGIKEAEVDMDGTVVKVAVANGLGNARKLLEEINSGRKEVHFIEVMTCPGGCINGGGQPVGLDKERIRERMKALYALDGKSKLRTSHANESIKKLYDEFLGEPLGHKSHELLHTSYIDRKDQV